MLNLLFQLIPTNAFDRTDIWSRSFLFFSFYNKQVLSRSPFFLQDRLSRRSWRFKGGQGDICRSAGGKSVRVRARRAREHGPSRTRGHVASLCRRLAPPFPATPHQQWAKNVLFRQSDAGWSRQRHSQSCALQDGGHSHHCIKACGCIRYDICIRRRTHPIAISCICTSVGGSISSRAASALQRLAHQSWTEPCRNRSVSERIT